jgi:hypothetical protein
MSVNFYETVWLGIPEGYSLRTLRRENQKSHKLNQVALYKILREAELEITNLVLLTWLASFSVKSESNVKITIFYYFRYFYFVSCPAIAPMP